MIARKNHIIPHILLNQFSNVSKKSLFVLLKTHQSNVDLECKLDTNILIHVEKDKTKIQPKLILRILLEFSCIFAFPTRCSFNYFVGSLNKHSQVFSWTLTKIRNIWYWYTKIILYSLFTYYSISSLGLLILRYQRKFFFGEFLGPNSFKLSRFVLMYC